MDYMMMPKEVGKGLDLGPEARVLLVITMRVVLGMDFVVGNTEGLTMEQGTLGTPPPMVIIRVTVDKRIHLATIY